MSGLRGRSAVPADHRSALPRVPGIPWWGAAIVAIVLTAIGVAYDAGSGNNSLGAVFAVCYVLGCVAAVLAVRQSGVFTAVIQPPLILFVAVPTAYFVFHGSTFTGIKDTLINYGYPLIERFPLMFFTSASVLVIGMIRWYLGVAARRAGTPLDDEAVADVPEAADAPVGATSGRRASSRAQRSTRAARGADAAALADPIDDEAPRAARRSARTGSARPSDPIDDEAPRAPRRSSRTSAGSERPSAASGSRRSRHARPSETEIIEPVRPRRRPAPEVDAPAEPRRRPRAGEPRDRDTREREPRDRDREPRERTPRERREPRDRRPLPPLDTRAGQERAPRRERPEGYERPERPRRPRPADYEPYEPPPSRTNGSSTHHPVSRVRYRGSEDGESRTENRSRRPRHSAPDSWE